MSRKSLKIRLGKQVNFGESYSLVFTKGVTSKAGNSLAEQVQLNFQINQPKFNTSVMVNKNRLQFDIKLNQSGEKIFTKVKVTNNTGESVPYIGFNGCDRGLNAALFTDTKDDLIREPVPWHMLNGPCTDHLPQYQLQPGESIELATVLYPPAEPVNGELYAKVIFQRGTSESNSSYTSNRNSDSFKSLIINDGLKADSLYMRSGFFTDKIV